MIQSKKFFVMAAFVAASIALAAPDGVTLRKTLRQGTETYHLETTTKQTVTIPGGGDQDMGMSSRTSYSFKIGTVDATAGQAPVEVVTKVEKFDLEGPMADAMAQQKDKLMAPMTVKGKLDSRGRFTPDTSTKVNPRTVMMGASSASIIGPMFEFPEKALNIGDTWDIVLPKGPMNLKGDQKLAGKLVNQATVDGKSVYNISISGTIKMLIKMADLIKDNPDSELEAAGITDMTMDATIELSGDAVIDKDSGQTISMNIKMKSKQEASIPALGDTKIPMAGTSTIKVTLDK